MVARIGWMSMMTVRVTITTPPLFPARPDFLEWVSLVDVTLAVSSKVG
jgi:hypothetical protein